MLVSTAADHEAPAEKAPRRSSPWRRVAAAAAPLLLAPLAGPAVASSAVASQGKSVTIVGVFKAFVAGAMAFAMIQSARIQQQRKGPKPLWEREDLTESEKVEMFRKQAEQYYGPSARHAKELEGEEEDTTSLEMASTEEDLAEETASLQSATATLERPKKEKRPPPAEGASATTTAAPRRTPNEEDPSARAAAGGAEEKTKKKKKTTAAAARVVDAPLPKAPVAQVPPAPRVAKPKKKAAAASPSKPAPMSDLKKLFAKKKPDRAVDLRDLVGSSGGAASPNREVQDFAVGVAGFLLFKLGEEDATPVLDPADRDLETQLVAPWTERAKAAAGTRQQQLIGAWREHKGGDEAAGGSYLDLLATPVTRDAWRAYCDANVVVPYSTFGLAPSGAPKDDAVAALAALAPVASTDDAKAAAAEAFANVVNALLVPVVDEAIRRLRGSLSEVELLAALRRVATVVTRASTVYESLGLPPLAKPVVYEGKASKSQLQALFSRYAAAAVAQGLKEDAVAVRLDVDAVDLLQAIFSITDKRAEKLADEVVKQLVQQMIRDASADDAAGAGGLESLFGGGAAPGLGGGFDPNNPPSDAEIDRQLSDLQAALDSGALSAAEKTEIRDTFKQMLGNVDVEEAMRAADQNRAKLDPRSRKALDLLRQLV